MTPKRRQRLVLVVLVLGGVGAAVALGLTALDENLMYFYSPTQIVEGPLPEQGSIRLGGLVADGSVERTAGTLEVYFTVTDGQHSVRVRYDQVLPDLFREGQGVVARGVIDADGLFQADEVLAKHDEEYMPPEVAEALAAAHEEATGTPVPEPAADGDDG